MTDGQERTLPHADLLLQLGWVQRLARNLVRDPNVAADVAQDVWLKTQGRGMDSAAGLRRWLHSVTRGIVSDSRREAGRRQARERAAARLEAQPSTSDVVERNALQQRVSAAVMELAEPYRSSILYRYMDDVSTAEIARRMSVTEEAVRQRLARARKTLRARLDRECGGASGAWAFAILGSSSASRLATRTTTASASASALTSVKVAALGVTVLGAVAGWSALAPAVEPTAAIGPDRAAVVAYDLDESEFAVEPPERDRRRPVRSNDELNGSLRLLDGPEAGSENTYMLTPFQMW